MRQISTVGIFLGAAALMLSACGKGKNNCDSYYNNTYGNNYSSTYGYSATNPNIYNQNYNQNYNYNNNTSLPQNCIPTVTSTNYQIPGTLNSSYDPTKILLQNLQNYWGNVVVRQDVQIAATGVATLDVVKAGSYTWAALKDRLNQIAAKCPACLTSDPGGLNTSSLSLFARIDYDQFSSYLTFDHLAQAEVQFTKWNYYYFGTPPMTRMSHVIAALMSGFQQSWGYTVNQWCGCQYWNTGYYGGYSNYFPQNSFGLSVGYANNSLAFGIGVNVGW